MSMFFPLFFMLPFAFSEATLPVLLFLQLSGAGAGAPVDLAQHLPDDVVAYARIVHQPEAAGAVRKGFESARTDEEFRVLMDRMIEMLEKESGFREGGFTALTQRLRGIHVALHAFTKESAAFALVFEATSEEAAGEILDHSDRFFQEAIFEKIEGNRYRFAPAGDEGTAIRVRNLIVFGTKAEDVAASLAEPPAKTLAASERYRKAIGEGEGGILLGYANGERVWADLRATLDFDDQKQFDQADSFVGFTEFEFLRMSASFREGRLRNETVLGMPEDALFRVFEPQASELDADLFLRASGANGFGLQIKDPKAYWKEVSAHLLEQEKTVGWDDISRGLEEFEEAMGRSVGDVLGLLDGRLVVGIPEISELVAAETRTYRMEDGEEPEPQDFPATFAFRLADPSKAEEFLTWLLTEGPAADGAEAIPPTTHQGVSIHGFVADGMRFRYYFDGEVLVFGGKGIEGSLDRVRGEGAAAAKARIVERLNRVAPLGFGTYLGGGSGMSTMMLFFAGARMAAMGADMGGDEEMTRPRRVPYRQPIELPQEGADAVGTARFAPIGLSTVSLASIDGVAVKHATALILRSYFQNEVENCLATVETLFTLVQRHHAEHDEWPATLEAALTDDGSYWLMGCRPVEGSSEEPSKAYTYVREQPAGVAAEDALWIYETELNHPFGRTVAFRDGRITFLYEAEFQAALAKSKK